MGESSFRVRINKHSLHGIFNRNSHSCIFCNCQKSNCWGCTHSALDNCSLYGISLSWISSVTAYFKGFVKTTKKIYFVIYILSLYIKISDSLNGFATSFMFVRGWTAGYCGNFCWEVIFTNKHAFLLIVSLSIHSILH